MFAHERLPSERVTTRDPDSGCAITRLTGAIGHSHGLYFTSDGWTRDGGHLVIASERAGRGNQLYAVDLASGDLLRVTDLPPGAARDHDFNYAALDPTADRIAYWAGRELRVLDLVTGAERTVHVAEGDVHGTSWNADGRWILTCRSEERDVGTGVSSADRMRWLADPPLSQVIAVAADGSGCRVLHEERWLITHVNASPRDPDLITFCHEGPWLEIRQRIWGLRISGGAPWPIVPRDPQWGVGHEYWCADGRTIGYHARHRDGTWRHAAGFADAVTGTGWQAELAVPTHHAVAIAPDAVFLDGTRESGGWLLAVPRDGDRWGEPRVVCRHDSSRHHHRVHVHARPRRDGRALAFNSDRRGYGDVLLVELPERLGDLPPYPGRPFRFYWE